MTIRKILLNNKPLHSSEIDRGLQFGDGHFTTIRILNGVPLFIERHLQRLSHANACLFINHPHFNSLHERISNACSEVQEGVCKVILTRGYGGRGYSFSDNTVANEYIQISDLPTPIQTVRLGVAQLRLAKQPILAGLKTLNRMEQVLLTKECRSSSFDDLLVCDSEGSVVEAIQGNIFWHKQGQWHTPELNVAGVNGVIRQFIIDEGLLESLHIGDYSLDDLTDIDQMVITNSVRGAVTVARFNGKVLDSCELSAILEPFIL